MLDRRSLLTLVAGASVATIIPVRAQAKLDENPMRDWIVIDSLGGFENSDVQRDGRVPTGAGTIDRQKLHDAIASGMTAANQTIGYVSGENEPRRAKGRTPLTFIPELSGPDQFRSLARRLARRGPSAVRIEKIVGLNFLRFARGVWGA